MAIPTPKRFYYSLHLNHFFFSSCLVPKNTTTHENVYMSSGGWRFFQKKSVDTIANVSLRAYLCSVLESLLQMWSPKSDRKFGVLLTHNLWRSFYVNPYANITTANSLFTDIR